MKRFAVLVGAALGLLGANSSANASWASLKYSGYQPWYNVFAKKNKCLTPEEERLQKFWHDYYNALQNYYAALDNIDWVAYYKNHGYQINGGACGPCGSGRINYAPVFVSPTLQWAVPNSCLNGPPVPPYGACAPAAPGHGPVAHGGYGPGYGPGAAPGYGPGPGFAP
jgi:hypothetical protein